MPHTLFSAAAAGAVLLAACGEAEQSRTDTSAPPPVVVPSPSSRPVAKADSAISSPILVRGSGHELAQAESLYRTANAPQRHDLTGVWFQTLHIMARGRPGDLETIYRIDSTVTTPAADGDQSRHAWTLRFPEKDSADDHFVVVVGGHPDRLTFQFDATGDLLFAPDFAADNSPTYHCRAVTAGRLICYDTQYRQEAFEFSRAPVNFQRDAR